MKIAMKYLEEQMAEVALEIMELTSTAKKKLQETDDHKKRVRLFILLYSLMFGPELKIFINVSHS